MTPQERKDLIAAVDHAVNVGAHISINFHPEHTQDAEVLRSIFLDGDWSDESFGPNGRGFIVQGARPAASTHVFDATDGARIAHPMGDNINRRNRAWDVVI
jgi:hypothetical protein